MRCTINAPSLSLTHSPNPLLGPTQVVAALAGGPSRGHVPYRNSKLTDHLRDALSPAARLVLVATVSPRRIHANETWSTLRFAQHARGGTQTAHNATQPAAARAAWASNFGATTPLDGSFVSVGAAGAGAGAGAGHGSHGVTPRHGRSAPAVVVHGGDIDIDADADADADEDAFDVNPEDR